MASASLSALLLLLLLLLLVPGLTRALGHGQSRVGLCLLDQNAWYPVGMCRILACKIAESPMPKRAKRKLDVSVGASVQPVLPYTFLPLSSSFPLVPSNLDFPACDHLGTIQGPASAPALLTTTLPYCPLPITLPCTRRFTVSLTFDRKSGDD